MKNEKFQKRKVFGKLMLSVVFLFLICMTSKTHAAVNKQINYQGKLTNTSGWAVPDGNFDMRFKIYDAVTDGNLLWTGTHTTANGNPITISRGIFSTLLGSGTGNALNLDFSTDSYYLQVEIYNTNTTSWETFNNRKRFGAVPQAFNANGLIGNGYIDIDSILAGTAAADINYNPTTGTANALSVTYGSSGGTGTALKVTQQGSGYAGTFMGGYVGIGTTSPGERLHVVGNILLNNDGVYKIKRSDGYATYVLGMNSNDEIYFTGTNSNNLNINFKWLNSGGEEQMVILGNGNVGIGTTDPLADLDMGTGGIRLGGVTQTSWPTASSQWINNGNKIGYALDNVGIGTTDPGARLQVMGNGTGYVLIGDTTYTNHVGVSFNGSLAAGNYNLDGAPGDSSFYINRPTGGAIRFAENDGYPQMTIYPGGNIGMGYFNPGNAKLAVNGYVGIGTTDPQAELDMASGGIRLGGVTRTSWPSGSSQWVTNGTSIGYILGNVGIGMTNPVNHLQIDAGLNGSGAGLYINSLTRNSSENIFYSTGNSAGDEIVMTADGNLGIGNTYPQASLSVGLSTSFNSYAKIGIADNGNAGIQIKDLSNSVTADLVIYSSELWIGPATNHGLAFQTNDTRRMSIDGSTGSVGINGVNTGYQLYVAGTINASGTVSSPSQFLSTKTNGAAAFFANQYSGSSGYANYLGNWASNGYWGMGPLSGSGDSTIQIGNSDASGNWSGTQNLNLVIGGNIGIGTTSPTSPLTIKTSSATGTGLYVDASSATTGIGVNVKFDGSTVLDGAYAYKYTRDSSLYFSVNDWGFISAAGITTAYRSYYDGGTGVILGSSPAATKIGSWDNADIELYPNGTGDVLIRNGNVGIGWTAPGSKLTISGGLSIGTTSITSLYLTKKAPDGGAIFEGSVGIGTTNPLAALDMGTGGIRLGGVIQTSWPSGSSQWINNGSNIGYSLGSVGIGTTAPRMTLSVIGLTAQIEIGEDYADDSTTRTTPTIANSYLHLGAQEFNAGSYRLMTFGYHEVAQTYPAAYFGFQDINTGGWTYGDLVFGTRSTTSDVAPTERMRITNTGFVGIGFTNPGSKLTISGGLSIGTTSSSSIYLTTQAPDGGAIFEGSVGIGTTSPDINYKLHVSGGSVLIDGGQALQFGSNGSSAITGNGWNNSSDYLAFETQWAFRMKIDATGNVGIGIGLTNPGSRLTISGGLAIGTTSISSLYLTKQAPDGGAIFEGNVGIGTTNPLYKLQIAGSLGVSTTVVFSGITDGGTELTGILINNSNQLVTREFGSNAFNSSTYLTGAGTANQITYWSNATTLAGENQLSISRGGLGMGTAPTSGQILIGNSSNGYSLAQITQGNGIGVTSASGAITINNSDRGSSQYIYKNIAIGTSTIQAGSNNDTLTFTAGANINITANTATDTITISATGGSSQWTTNGTDIGYITGNVGIGTTNPTQALYITSANSAGTNLGLGNTSAGGINWFLASNGSGATYGPAGSFTLRDATNNYSAFTVLKSTGYMGLGTTNPGAMLDIFGTGNGLRLSYNAANYATISTNSTGDLTLLSSNTSESSFIIGDNTNVNVSLMFDSSTTDYYMGRESASGNLYIGTGLTVGSNVKLVMDTNGNVGIGTTAAIQSKLTISGGLSIGTTSVTSLYLTKKAPDGGAIFESSVGIGTTNPTAKLEVGVFTAVASASNYGIKIGGMNGTSASSLNYGINLGDITQNGSSSDNYGLYMGNIAVSGPTSNTAIKTGMVGYTLNNYQMLLGNVYSYAGSGGLNYGIFMGTISGSSDNATNAQFRTGNVTGGATNSYQLNLGSVSGATTNYGINLASSAATVSGTSYGINIGGWTGAAASSNNYGLKITAPTATSATANYGLNITSVSGATHNAALEIGTAATEAGTWGIYSSDTSSSYLAGNLGIGNTSPSAFLTIKQATASAANIRLMSSSATLSSPNIGDLWFTGTSLNFRKDGTTTQDLLAATGSMTNPMTTAGDIIFGSGPGATPTRLGGSSVNGYVLKYNTAGSAPYWAEDLTTGGTPKVSLASGSADSDISADPSIWINDTGGGDLIKLSTGATPRTKFTIANNGSIAVNTDTNNVTKTTTGDPTNPSDFEYSGAGVGNTAVYVNAGTNPPPGGTLQIVDGAIPNSGQGQASAPGTTTTNAAVGAGAHTILRDDGKFVIIHGGGSLTASVWDGTTTGAMSALAQNVGIAATVPSTGAISLKRPNGRYLLVAGGGTLNAAVYDPFGISAPTVGPAGGVCTSGSAGDGTNAFMRQDGKYVILCGGTVRWGVYDPNANTYTAGTAIASSFGVGAFAIQRDDGTFLVFRGGGSQDHYIYNPFYGTMSTINPMGTGSEVPTVTTGAFAIRRNDGKFAIFPGAQYTMHIYDPSRTSANSGAGTITKETVALGYGPSAALQTGASAMWMQNGKYYFMIGVGSTATNIYNPSIGTGQTAFTTNTGTGLLQGVPGNGFHTFMTPDGKTAVIRGGGTAIDTIDTGIVIGGTGSGTQLASYTTECIDLGSPTALNASSTLNWNASGEGTVSFKVYLSNNSNCSSPTITRDIPNNGDLIRPSSTPERYIQVRVYFKRDMPKFLDQEWGMRRNNSQVRYRRSDRDPSLYDFTIDNSAAFHRNQFELGGGGSGGANSDVSGPITLNVTNSPDGMGLTLTPGFGNSLISTTVNVNDPIYYNGAFQTHNNMNVGTATTAASGTIIIRRPDGQYMKISAGTQSAELYDPVAMTWTNQTGTGNIPSGSCGWGALAVKRPDGKYLIIHGGTTTAGSTGTSIYDPSIGVGQTAFIPGPTLPTIAGEGAQAIPLPDGRIFILHGNRTVSTSLYNPNSNIISSSAPPSPAVVGAGSVVIPRPDGTYWIATGETGTVGTCTTANAVTYIFDPYRFVFTVNIATAGYGRLSASGGVGAHAFQRSDGMWVIIHGANGAGTFPNCVPATTTTIYNPYTNRTSIGPALPAATVGATSAANTIQRADGTWMTIGLGSTGANGNFAIYAEKAGSTESAAAGESSGTGMGVFLVAGTTPQNIATGNAAFQRDDGKYVIIPGGNSAVTTYMYDGGWTATGSYRSEAINVPNLSSASALVWKGNADPNTLSAEVKTATSKDNLQTAFWKDFPVSGGLINPGGSDVWMQVRFSFKRFFPSLSGIYQDVWFNGGGAMSYNYRTFKSPVLKSFAVTNDVDLINLQTESKSMFRVSSSGDIYTSASGSINTGGADLAENYTSTQALEKGEIVSMEGHNNEGVVRSTGLPGQSNIIGVVSTKPGFVAGSYTKDSFPIALVGRVPVKVSTQNGIIRTGDRIAASSIPGYGMRATTASRVIGTALEPMDETKLGECPVSGYASNAKCMEIMVFVNLTDYDGMPIDTLIAEQEANGVAYDATDSLPEILKTATGEIQAAVSSDILHAGKVLDFLNKIKDSQIVQTSSEIFASSISASKEIVSPLIVADTIIAKNIKVDQIEGLEFIQRNIADAQNVSADNADGVKNLGQEMNGLKAQLDSLFERSNGGNGATGLDVASIKDSKNSGALAFDSLATFKGGAIFQALTEFFDKVTFQGEVQFNSDTAGYAIVKEKEKTVSVAFEHEYSNVPIVNVTLSLQNIDDQELRDATEELILSSDVKYMITNVSTKGFEIKVDSERDWDIPFSWQALSVKDARTFVKREDISDPLQDLFPVENAASGDGAGSAENTTATENTDSSQNASENSSNSNLGDTSQETTSGATKSSQ
jgi:hypothetical protein